jgi:thiol-disulfide isomerase/thioredoxin
MATFIKRHRNAITMGLALAGIALMAFYTVCDTSCAYLKGDVWGVDLKWIGIAYMLAILGFAACKQTSFIRALLAMGIGVEVYLIAFQFKEDVFCPFCLAFAAMILAAFMMNYDISTRLQGSWRDKILYALGDVALPRAVHIKIPALLFAVMGYLFMFLAFSGSATPAYGQGKAAVPSWGAGRYELLVFTDYFCHPCQTLEVKLEPALENLLSKRGVRVTFIDLPIYKLTPLYNKYFLYAANTDGDYKAILHARRALFNLAKTFAAADEAAITKALTAEGVAFKPFDAKSLQVSFNSIIKKYKVDSTPTCIIKYSERDIRTYRGPVEIMEGIVTLQNSLKKGPR